jgi:plasmid stabilization system protein ParE
MRIVFTDEALRDLDEILDFIAARYPTIASPFQQRLKDHFATHRQLAEKRGRSRVTSGCSRGPAYSVSVQDILSGDD